MNIKEFKKGDTISAYYWKYDSVNKHYKAEYLGFYRLTVENRRIKYIEILCKHRSNRLEILRANKNRTFCTCRMVLFEKTLNLLN